MKKRDSNWEAELIREMEEIAFSLLGEEARPYNKNSALSKRTQFFAAKSPNADLVIAFARLYDLLSPYDQWLLNCGAVSSVSVRCRNGFDAIRICAYIVEYGTAYPNEPKAQPGITAFMGAVFHYALTRWRVLIHGGCEWERTPLARFIPSGR